MIKNSYYAVLVAFVAGLSGLLFGYDTGVISGAILFISKEFHLSSAMNGFVVSAVLMGACAASLVCGRLTDDIGRKRMLIMDAILFIVGTLIASLASSITILFVGRVIVGIAIGIASFTAPLYISEIAPKQYRGAMVSLNQLAIAAGIFISYLVDYHFSHQAEWRWMLGVGVVPAFALMIGLFFLPYSPRWMAKKGNYGKAFFILNQLRVNSRDAEIELGEMIDRVRHSKRSWCKLFRTHLSKTLIVGIGLAVIQQVTGINTVLYYAPTLFQMSGFHAASSAIFASIGVGVLFLLFTFVSILLIDKLGRKPLLYIGLIFMAIALLGMIEAFQLNTSLLATKILLLSSVFLYVIAFALSLGPIAWLMIAEIFPTHYRGFGASIATFFNWASNGLVAMSFLSLVDRFGKVDTFSIYFIACVLSLFFVYYCVPETKGCSLEKIEADLFAGCKLRNVGKSVCTSA